MSGRAFPDITPLDIGQFTFAADEPWPGELGVVVAYAIRRARGRPLLRSAEGPVVLTGQAILRARRVDGHTRPGRAGRRLQTEPPTTRPSPASGRSSRAACCSPTTRPSPASGRSSRAACCSPTTGGPGRGEPAPKASLLDCAGRARRGTSGALNLQSAPAGLNSHPRTASLQAAASSDVEDRVPRSDEPRTVSGPEGSSTKRSSSGAAERPGPSRSSWRARGPTGRRWVHGTFISRPRTGAT